MTAEAAAVVGWLSMTPVKSLRIQEVSEVHLGPDGVEGDRRFLLSDSNGHLFNGKRMGALMQVIAESAPPHTALTLRFPDGEVVSGDVELGARTTVLAYRELRPVRAVLGPWSEALSAFADVDVRLVEPLAGGGGVDRYPGGGVTMLSAASVGALAGAAGVAAVDRRRFRMNIGLEGPQAFEEERWLGRVVAIGEATVRLNGNVGRCAVTTENPVTGVADLRTLHLLRDLRAGAPSTEPLPFGVGGEVVQPGRVRLGDAVRVL
jgi:uncharacterized protein YcbX